MVLWCLFTGQRHPWIREGTTLYSDKYVKDFVRMGKRPKPDAPPAIRAFIERCWAQDPSLRPTATTLAREAAAGRLQLPLPPQVRASVGVHSCVRGPSTRLDLAGH